MRPRKLLLLLAPLSVAALGDVRAQVAVRPLNPPAPLAAAAPNVASAGAGVLTVASAQRAQELGLPAVAAGLYRQLLAAPGGTAAEREGLTLALATALLRRWSRGGSREDLNGWVGLHAARGTCARGSRRRSSKRSTRPNSSWRRSGAEDLPKEDVAWLYFLEGVAVRPTAGPGRDQVQRRPTTRPRRRRRPTSPGRVSSSRRNACGSRQATERRRARRHAGEYERYRRHRGRLRHRAQLRAMLDKAERKDDADQRLAARRACSRWPRAIGRAGMTFRFCSSSSPIAGREARPPRAHPTCSRRHRCDRQREALQLLGRRVAGRAGARAVSRLSCGNSSTRNRRIPVLESLLLFMRRRARDATTGRRRTMRTSLLERFPARRCARMRSA